jgi:hypothetical protein
MVMKLTYAGAGFRPALRITKRLSYFIPISILLNLSLLSPALPQAFQRNSDWQVFERMVRDGNISYHDGEKAIAEWANRLETEFPQGQFRKDIFFPLKGYSIKDVGGKLHVMLLTSKGMQPMDLYPLWSPSSSGR